MPRTNNMPHIEIQPSVFKLIEDKIKAQNNPDLIRLHIGDTIAFPPLAAQPAQFPEAKYKDYNQYCDLKGILPLRETILKKLHDRNKVALAFLDNIQVMIGATHGLYAAFKIVMRPGEKILSLAPFWPIIKGVYRSAEVTPMEIPFYTLLMDNPKLDIHAYLSQHLTSDTTAIYFNNPNNPTGYVLEKAQLEAIVSFAKEHKLWIISDEAYEDFIYTTKPHIAISSLKDAFERTISIFTFSKTYAVAGYRVGYVVAPANVIGQFTQLSLGTIYGVSTMLQYMVLEAMQDDDKYLTDLRNTYRELRDACCQTLRIPAKLPESSFYLFANVEQYLESKGIWGFINKLIENGVSVSPGEPSGKDYRDWIRISYVSASANRIREAMNRINQAIA